MRKRALFFALLLLLAAAPAMAAPAVVFEPGSAQFIIGMPFDAQPTPRVGVSLGDGAAIGAIRFLGGVTSQDIGAIYSDNTGLFVSADIVSENTGRLTFAGAVPDLVGYGRYPIQISLYADAGATTFIASADFDVQIANRYNMAFEDPPAIVSGESLDIRVKVTFDDNLTGSEDLRLPLKSLTRADKPGGEAYNDLGLTITPDPATSTIRITSDAAKLGTETYWFNAESDRGTIGESGLEIAVTEHALTFSTPMLLAMAFVEVDDRVAFVKKPAETPLASFDIVMTISDDVYDEENDEAPAFPAVSSDTGTLRWNGLSIDLEMAESRLRVHGMAEEQWQGELLLKGWLKGTGKTGDPRLVSDPLNIVTLQLEEGDLLDFDNTTLTDADGNALSRMVLDAENTLTFPLRYDLPDESQIVATVRTPAGVITHLPQSAAALTTSGVATRAAGKNFVIRYTPQEAGDYIFEFVYAKDGMAYYQDAKVGAGDLPWSASSGCNAGFGAFALLALAGTAAFLRRKG